MLIINNDRYNCTSLKNLNFLNAYENYLHLRIPSFKTTLQTRENQLLFTLLNSALCCCLAFFKPNFFSFFYAEVKM